MCIAQVQTVLPWKGVEINICEVSVYMLLSMEKASRG